MLLNINDYNKGSLDSMLVNNKSIDSGSGNYCHLNPADRLATTSDVEKDNWVLACHRESLFGCV